MLKNLRYIDEKSDKFWRVETLANALVLNWGKTGTAGRYDIKEFASAEICLEQAEKLLAGKLKKGYQEMPDFDLNNHLYFDIADWGPHRLTSHPLFRQYFADDLYYDCGDEDAPFGSDEGNDTLWELQNILRKKQDVDFADFPRWMIEDEWGLTYLPPQSGQTDEQLLELAAQSYNGLPGDMELLNTVQVILAAAFGQLKIVGQLDEALQSLAFLALERWEKLARLLYGWSEEEPPYNVRIMRRDLTAYANSLKRLGE